MIHNFQHSIHEFINWVCDPNLENFKRRKIILVFCKKSIKTQNIGEHGGVSWQSKPSEYEEMAIFLTCYFSFIQLPLEIKESILKFSWITTIEGNTKD